MINLNRISFSYNQRQVLAELSLTIDKGEIIAVLGASGSGKSTLLNICAGLLRPETGDIVGISGTAPSTALVFQDYALFPNLSVLENLKFVSSDMSAIEEWVNRLKLETELNKKPNQLSGGQKQRVAVARAMLCQPELLLMDEPFSNLDTAHRASLRLSLRQVLKEQGQSALMVTHDLEDAFSLADNIAVLDKGKILQISSPQDLYKHPSNQTIMQLSGPTTHFSVGGENYYCRPEHLSLTEQENRTTVKVTGCQFSGVFFKIFYQQAEQRGYFYHPELIQSGELTIGIKTENLLQF